MSATIAVTDEVTTLINTFTVEPDDQPKLLELLRENADTVISNLDGWISTRFIASADRRRVVIYSQWRDVASVEGMRADPRMKTYFPRIGALAKLESLSGEVVYSHHA